MFVGARKKKTTDLEEPGGEVSSSGAEATVVIPRRTLRRESLWRQTFKVQPPAQKETQQEAVERLKGTLAEVPGSIAAPVICILGGTTFNDAETRQLVESLADEVTKQIGKQAVFVTTGKEGVQRTFAEHCGRFVRIFNLLPVSEMEKGSGVGCGVDLFGGKQIEDCKAIFAELGDIYISVEGGPGVAGEARAAHARGAPIVPLPRSGGASAGMYDFPDAALQKPDFASEEQWALVGDDTASPEESARAAAGIVFTLLESIQVERAARISAEKSALQGRQGAPPPAGIETMDMSSERYLARAFEMMDPDKKFVLDRPRARKFLRILGWMVPDEVLEQMLNGATLLTPADPEKRFQNLFTKRQLFDICENNKKRPNGDLEVFREGLKSLADDNGVVKKQRLIDLILAEDGRDCFALKSEEVEQIFRILGFHGDGSVDVDRLAVGLMTGVAHPPSGHEILEARPWNGPGII
mmetsp:Transcript_57180/g.145182  ORF Transcript_57180/g.145182 Transcript_57180/m.145182 type:complete len:469 (+) Transcript_57180:118-1524(+)